MKYNFDEIIPRKNTNSIKWDLAENDDVLPMWVADMDFKTPPEIIKALSEKALQGIFGYSFISEEFYDSIIYWWKISYQYDIKKNWILPAPGTIPAISAIIRAYLQPGENIIIQPPVYNHFFMAIENCDCNAVENKLIYENDDYQIDFEDLEIKAKNPKAKMLLLCNPQNPVGKVWTREELEKIVSICSQNNVILVSDEIHADLVFENYCHIPLASVVQSSDIISFTCGSPCKTFNISGLSVAYIISKNQKDLKPIEKLLQQQETTTINPFAVEALITAYTQGKDWMEELKNYIFSNYQFLKDFCKKNMPEIKVISLQATYLVWLDCRFLGMKSDDFSKLLLEEEKLWLNSGTMYGDSGEGFLRMNIACPKDLLIEGLKKLENGYNKALNKNSS